MSPLTHFQMRDPCFSSHESQTPNSPDLSLKFQRLIVLSFALWGCSDWRAWHWPCSKPAQNHQHKHFFCLGINLTLPAPTRRQRSSCSPPAPAVTCCTWRWRYRLWARWNDDDYNNNLVFCRNHLLPFPTAPVVIEIELQLLVGRVVRLGGGNARAVGTITIKIILVMLVMMKIKPTCPR